MVHDIRSSLPNIKITVVDGDTLNDEEIKSYNTKAPYGITFTIDGFPSIPF
jgi:hypothetical protein